MDIYVCRLGGVGYKYVVNRVKEDRAEKQHVNKTDLIPDVSGINHYSGNNHYNTGIYIYRYGDIYICMPIDNIYLHTNIVLCCYIC